MEAVRQLRLWEKIVKVKNPQYVIGASASSIQDLKLSALAVGMNDFVPKPVKTPTLLEMIYKNHVIKKVEPL